jgi:hypothetical protein
MTKIHFACLLGVDYETDLQPFWAAHYLNMGLDSYKVFLHREKGLVPEEIIKEFRRYGFSVETIDGHQGNGKLRKLALGQYARALDKSDFLVTADADEFQMGDVPPSLLSDSEDCSYRRLTGCYDIISGYMLDRWAASGLEECKMDPFIQYPCEEDFTQEILKSVTPPFLQKTCWPVTRRTKILCARAGYDVAYEGSHCMTGSPYDAKISDGYKVIHFAWRESAARKAALKSYFNQANLDEIFGGKAPVEYSEALKKMTPDMMPDLLYA